MVSTTISADGLRLKQGPWWSKMNELNGSVTGRKENIMGIKVGKHDLAFTLKIGLTNQENWNSF